ncbi:MAG: VWA domain-containing protein [Sandaracinaceae bacterium]|nr:VWA domain-containing protein [Sandaracinaceae bacterium]
MRAFAIAIAFALASGCGSRTGLEIPDAGPDAGQDAGPDAGRPPRPCIEAPRELGRVTVEMSIPASLAVVDILFLIDSTGSMTDEIAAVRLGLRTRVVPGVRSAIPDAAFGVALFGEFPVRPHGPNDVLPFQLRSPITQDVARVEASLEETPVWGNFDDAEAAIEGLFQVLTGAGYGAPGTPGFVPASIGCPSGGAGGACFRRDALPMVMLITDAPMHNGPPGVAPEAPYLFSPPPHGYPETVEQARRLRTLVLGLGASDPGRPSALTHLRALARDTGSVDASGQPLVFDIGSRGSQIGDEIVRAVERVASGVPLDVDAVAEDLPGDDVDAGEVLRGMRAVRADPPANVRAIEGERFLGVVPGTVLTFEVIVDASELPPSPERRVYPARILFRASGRSRLEAREVEIVVPGDDGRGCE